VAQLVGEQLELVRGETIVIPQYMVVGGATGALRVRDEGTFVLYCLFIEVDRNLL